MPAVSWPLAGNAKSEDVLLPVAPEPIASLRLQYSEKQNSPERWNRIERQGRTSRRGASIRPGNPWAVQLFRVLWFPRGAWRKIKCERRN